MSAALPATPQREAYAMVAADPRADRDRILALWRSGLAQNDCPDAKFDWYYLRNPEGTPLVFLLHASASADPVGVAALGPRQVRRGGEAIRGGVLVDFVVTPEHRSFFPALFLQKEMRRLGLEAHGVLFGLPNRQSEAIVKRAGYRCVGDVVRRVRVLRSASYLSRHVPRPLASLGAALFDHARMALASLRLRSSPYVFTLQHRPDARFDALWERAGRPGVAMGTRDARFLTWRFVDCPFGVADFYSLRRGSGGEIAAWAVTQPRGETLHVLDFLVDPAEADAGPMLWMELARAAWQRGLASLSVHFLGPAAITAGMDEAGLVSRDRRGLYAAFAGDGPDGPETWYFTSADEDA